jgi:hypothetical protein
MKKEEVSALEKDAVGFWLVVSQSLTTVVPLMDLIAFLLLQLSSHLGLNHLLSF